jgi:hypothetical protein
MLSRNPWFKPKARGVGIAPANALGWASLFVFVIVFSIAVHFVGSGVNPFGIILLIASILIFVLVIALTYEKS